MEKPIVLTLIKPQKDKKIKIGNQTFQLFLCDKVMKEKQVYAGYIAHNLKEVYLSKEVRDKGFVLTHEILHNIFLRIGNEKGLKNKKQIQKLRKNEQFIDLLTKYILSIYKFK